MRHWTWKDGSKLLYERDDDDLPDDLVEAMNGYGAEDADCVGERSRIAEQAIRRYMSKYD